MERKSVSFHPLVVKKKILLMLSLHFLFTKSAHLSSCAGLDDMLWEPFPCHALSSFLGSKDICLHYRDIWWSRKIMNDALFISVKHEPFRLTLNALSLNATLIDHFCTTRILGGIIGIFQMLWSFRKHLSKKKGRSLSKMRYSRKKAY